MGIKSSPEVDEVSSDLHLCSRTFVTVDAIVLRANSVSLLTRSKNILKLI